MAYSAAQLDMIVKLVIERLRERNGSAASAHSTESRDLATIHVVSEGKVDTSTLSLSEKVITTETLVDRLRGVSRVMVATGAVVTPAARDALRDQGIALQRGGRPIQSSAGTLVVASTESNMSCESVVGSLAAHCLPHDSCWKNLLGELTSRIATENKLAVLITTQAAVALCAANRNQKLRAILATSPTDVQESKRQLGANLLIADPAGRGVHGVRQLVATFAREGFIPPPRGLEL